MRANRFPWTRTALMLVGLPSGLVLGSACGHAQAATVPVAQAPSSNAMVNLVRLLVAQGTISKDNGDALIAEATREAEQAVIAQQQAASAAVRAALPSPAFGNPAPTAVASAAPAPNLPAPAPGTIRVPYVPESVRTQIRDELRADIMQQAKAEGWASPGKAAPDWTERFKLSGDVRLRSQSNLFSRFNSTQIPNFKAIVASGPLDLINSQIPLLNTTESRYNQLQLRMRLGLDAKINDHLKFGLQLATGNDASPNGTNVNLAGGAFKRAIYLQNAFFEAKPTSNWTIWGGRFNNPFWTTESLYDVDLAFDGVATELKLPQRMFGRLDWTLRGGAFPLDFGSQNFPETANTKSVSAQKWLFAAQLQGDLHLPGKVEFTGAVGYHHFANVSGRASAPCALYLGATQCSSDPTSPFYVQKGNTLSFIRRIVLDPSLPSTTVQSQPQLLGLTQKFHVLDIRGQVSVPLFDENRFSLSAEYMYNLGFRRSRACRYGLAGEPVNNGGSGGSGNICDTDLTKRTPYIGGKHGYELTAEIGRHDPWNAGEWRAFGTWRYLQSDVTLDAFAGDDFHLGGTNARGFILGAQLGLFKNMNVQARWYSANEIAGDPLAIDVVMFDINARF
ncbi:putative porin [Novosphingobium sp. FKTRR1]|uniref:putative porin n=1 Tax=Novosphingobium sp. FKTRR1 TaxID=2879118 RepID=UPI001CF04BA4|nr:putative porin [Novosphingobium sp. FKTRR1]